MGPDPQLIRLTMASLEKTTPASEMTADIVNGKMMEIKGTMLQMGIKVPIALNMTLAEYEKRLERFGRADGSTTIPSKETSPIKTEEKTSKETSGLASSALKAPATPATTVPGSPPDLQEKGHSSSSEQTA